MNEPTPVHLPTGEYVIISRAEYLRLRGGDEGLSIAETKAAIARETARRARLAREHSGLSQSELAKRLKVKQPTVSNAERGEMSISQAYLMRVLKACKLPADWVPPETES